MGLVTLVGFLHGTRSNCTWPSGRPCSNWNTLFKLTLSVGAKILAIEKRKAQGKAAADAAAITSDATGRNGHQMQRIIPNMLAPKTVKTNAETMKTRSKKMNPSTYQ